MIVATKLSKQGQISIPKKFIKSLSLNLGELVVIEMKNDKIVISKKQNPVKQFIGILNDKIDLNSQEFIKIRKKEAKL